MLQENSYRLLMVDDDMELLKMNAAYFEQRGYEVVCAQNAGAAIRAVSTARFDCMMLDIDLPDGDGFAVCTSTRENTNLPIIFLSVHTEDEMRIRGLTLGGDDYVCKPCSFAELELRVRLRIQSHPQERELKPLCFDELTIDPEKRMVTYQGSTVEFTRIEFDILYFLARHPQRVYSYEQLYDRIWHEPLNLGCHSVQVRVSEVRKKLYTLCPEREFIRTIRHQGYQFLP